MKILEHEINKSIYKNGNKSSYINSELSFEDLIFDELENKFYNNHYKLKKIKRSNPEYDEILNENDAIVEQIHLINHQG